MSLKSIGTALMCALYLAWRSPESTAQVIVNPSQISGTLSFANSNPSILSLLNAPGNEGMSNVFAQAFALPPAAYTISSSDTTLATSLTSTTYGITVDAGNPGIAYTIAPEVTLEGGLETYWFATANSAPVVIGSAPPVINFSETVGVVTVQFRSSSGPFVTVDGGTISATDTQSAQSAQATIPAGVSQQRIYLRGGTTHTLDITVHKGTNYYSNRIESYLSTNVAVVADQIKTVTMVIPSSGTLATINGDISMAGKFGVQVPGNSVLDYPDYTGVIAKNGPFQNQRWASLGGSNYITSSSGPFVLPNVVPNSLDPSSDGYTVYGQMGFGSNRTFQLFITPALGSGSNSPLAVAPGASVNLGNLFDINPGYLRGSILLQGPPETPGHASLFRGILHPGDQTTDGIPDYFATYGLYWSFLEVEGVDERAPGATHTASAGLAEVDFDGSFNSSSGAYQATYEAAVGGLAGEDSLWRPDILNVTLESGVITNDNDYFYNVYSISDLRTNKSLVTAGQAVTNDINYCFSEVTVVFHSTTGTFFDPQIRFSTGTFTNIDFQGSQANYSVDLEVAGGTPLYSTTATNSGQIVMYLPQGDYTLNPTVTPGSGTYALDGLQPINISVGCGQKISVETCLQLSLNAPSCVNTTTAHIASSVNSCSNAVSSISYTLNGGAPTTICTGCGSGPVFAFDINLPDACSNNTLVVTATDSGGGVSSVTTSIHYNPTAPVIQCPGDIQAASCDTNGAVVNFNVTATSGCTDPVTVICTPPSGSVFPVGVTTVHCFAADACGNTNQCSFNVKVGGSLLTIEHAVIIRWECGGTLQSATDPNGPWTDVPGATSPYAVATGSVQMFYRTR